MPTIAKNTKAYHDYELLETFEAGIQLTGVEVKSVKLGRVQLKDSFVKITKRGEAFLHNAHIARFQHSSEKEYDPYRSRKLLLHKQQLGDISQKMSGSNLTIVPTRIYNVRRGLIKVEIALARGKKKHEKRRSIEERESKRHIERTLKRHQ